MNDKTVFVDSAYVKLRDNIPMEPFDLKQLIALIRDSSWAYEQHISKEVIAALQSELITVLQQKFMQGQQPQ